MRLNNKWLRAAIPALLIHCSIGTVYCWSTFKEAIATQIGMSTFALGWAFSLAIFFLGMSAAFAGRMVEKNIHKSSLIACIFFTVGMIGTGFFIQNTTGTIGDDFIINVTAGKLAASTNGYTQFTTGTTLTFVAPYDCEVTLVSYQGQQASMNGVMTTSTTLTQQYVSGTTIVVASTGDGWLTSLTIAPVDSVTPFSVASITATSTITELAVGDTFDTSSVTVRGYDNSLAYYKKLSSNEYSVSSVDTSTAGHKTVTVTYNNLQSSFNITVSAEVSNIIDTNSVIRFGDDTTNNIASFGEKVTDTTKKNPNASNCQMVYGGYIEFTVAAGASVEIYVNYSADFQVEGKSAVKGLTSELGQSKCKNF